MNITCTRTLIGCVLLTALGCAAESSKSEANDEPMPNDAAIIDGMEPTDSPVDWEESKTTHLKPTTET